MAGTIEWPKHSGDLQLARDEIHVWAAPLGVEADPRAAFARTLSPDETARAQRFKFEKHRNRFIAGRGVLREILTRYLQIKPEELRFDYSANGKPGFAAGVESGGIHFNLAHSEDLALIAVTRIGPVGVDVECVREMKDMDELVERFFSVRENERFQRVAASEKAAAFFNLWTRKEALLKATGEGITRSLSLVEVSFLAGEPARLVAVAGDVEKAKEWSLKELAPAAGFVGALAVRNERMKIKVFATG
ncbi:MAG TPA: 4'-phosphopantetheinyl transferase superfamily protein [Verrucomicrobiae bacterium]|nr:4'-phosphopantetheinyl transferase superfamily protein [Verrucomicrobiae bacterium]